MPKKLLGMEQAEGRGDVAAKFLAESMARFRGFDAHAPQPLDQCSVSGITPVPSC